MLSQPAINTPVHSYVMDDKEKKLQAGLAPPLTEEEQAMSDAKAAEAAANGTAEEVASAAGEQINAGHFICGCAMMYKLE